MWKVGPLHLRSHLIVALEAVTSTAQAVRWLKAGRCDLACVTSERPNLATGHGAAPNAFDVRELLLDYAIWLNTTHEKTAEDACKLARLFRDVYHPARFAIKLEFYSRDKTRFRIQETMRAVKLLVADHHIVMPHLPASLDLCREATALGCHALRVLGSPIGSLRGVEHRREIERICCEKQVPVIVEGGLARPEDAGSAALLGADAILVNRAITSAPDPLKRIEQFREACAAAFPGGPAYE